MYRFLFTTLIFVAVADRVSAQTMLDLLPQDAAVAIAIRDLDELIKKGDRFVADSAIQVGLRPSMLFEEANKFLGINKGLNKKGIAALLLMRPEKKEDRIGGTNFEQLLVPVIPFTDADEMADNFGFPKGGLPPRQIKPTKKINNFDSFAVRTPSHLYLSVSENTLKRVLHSSPISPAFTEGQRKQLNESDILLYFGRHLWELEGDSMARELNEKFKNRDDPEEKLAGEQLAKMVTDLHHLPVGIHVGDGIGFNVIAGVSKESETAKLLKSLRENRPACSLKGLPEGNVLFAQALSSKGNYHVALVKGMVSLFMEGPFGEKFVPPLDRFQYLGIMQEVWNLIDGNRLAIYQNADENQLGLFSAVAILDTNDGARFVRQLKTLTKMAEASTLDLTRKEVQEELNIAGLAKDLGSASYPVRQSASTRLLLIGEPALPELDKTLATKKLDLETTRRTRVVRDRIAEVAAERRKALLDDKNKPLFPRPSLTFVPGVEKRAGVSVDAVHIKMAGLEKVKNHQYKQLLGPDWDKMRIAVVGKQVVVLMGSDLTLFDAALKNVQQGNNGLAGSKRFEEFEKRRSPQRVFEVHASGEAIMRLLTPQAPKNKKIALTSFAFSVEPTSLQVDVWVPMSEVRAIREKAEPQPREQ